ncbi:uncharacterized protein [Battus philenor]|uniref:uncharacterized protein n=1 Tax=Battus philenor TaxID=42288 RepID=UPI0035D088DF
MDHRQKRRSIYVTARQKKKLIELMTKHPELISCKVTNDFKYKDSQTIWQNIANECNSIPGAKKTWRQWRKTWQDLRSKTKKKHAETNGEFTRSSIMLTEAEQKVLGINNVGDIESLEKMHEDNFDDDSSIEEESLPEEKIGIPVPEIDMDLPKFKKKSKHHSKNSDSKCNLNCEIIVLQEQKKLGLKEDYLNFKKEYLKQKLKLLKEQNDALKSIAKELSKIK